ncbi:hypothetical protein B6259_01770 [Ruminococcaceae bacterium CPB6]|nr:hypothetical protein B6259_01770 [Ruminococcaceae bacterium CPB6]
MYIVKKIYILQKIMDIFTAWAYNNVIEKLSVTAKASFYEHSFLSILTSMVWGEKKVEYIPFASL